MALTQAVTSSRSETVALGQATLGQSTLIFQIDAAGTWVGSFQPLKKVAGSTVYRNTAYTKHLNGLVDTAPITGSGIFSMDITGCEPAISHTLTTSGSVIFNYSIVRN